MNRFLRLVTALVFTASGLFGATAKDIRIPQLANVSPPSWPDVIVSPAANSLLGFGADKTVGNVTAGTGIVISGGVISAPENGTVTSFSAGNLSPLFTTSVATPTSTPALSFSLSTQAANVILAGPTTGAAAAPTFRALVAADLPATAVTAGTYGSATQSVIFTVDAAGRLTAAANATVTPAVGSITGLGTGVATALAVNVGSAGAFVTFNGALGTPSSGTLTNTTGFPAASLAGTTLASNVVTSSLTTVGTIGTGTWNATAIADGKIASALTGKTYNGLTVSTTTGTFTLTNGKTLAVANSLNLSGTDGANVAFGAGGTVLYSGGSYVASIAGTANEITASAATGAVTLSLPAALTFTGKTVTGGNFNATAFNGPIGGTTPAAGIFTAVTNSSMTAGRVPFAGTGGLMSDDSDMTFATDTLTVTKGTLGTITHVAGGIGNVTSLTGGSASSVTVTSASGASHVFGAGGTAQNHALNTVNTTAASWTTNGIAGTFGSGSTYTNSSTAGSGTAASAVAWSFATPTFAATNSSVTITDAATIYLGGSPAAGTNATLTNAWGIWNVGRTRLDGTVQLGTVTGPSATNVIISGGSAGAQITFGQGASGVLTLNSAGNGAVFNSDINITASNPGLRINDLAGTHYNWYVGGQTNVNNGFEITPSTTTGGSTFTTPILTITQAGATSVTGSFTTGAPSGGTAAAWKLGTVVTGVTSTLVTTNYIQVEIGGTLYKLATVTSVP